VDPRASLDAVEKRKFLTLPGLELGPLGHPANATHSTNYTIPTPNRVQEGFLNLLSERGACSNVVGRGTMLQAGRLWVRFPMKSLDFFN
jgi:hypothetical protein